MDKNGIALGRIYAEQQSISASGVVKRKVSFAQALIASGLAKVDRYLASDGATSGSPETLELLAGQQAAKEACKGLWSLPQDEPVEAEQQPSGDGDDGEAIDLITGQPSSSPSSKASAGNTAWKAGNTIPVVVSEIVDGCTFFVQKSDSLPLLAEFTTIMGELLAAKIAEKNNIEPGEIVEPSVDQPAVRKGQLVAVLFDEGAGRPVTQPPAPSYVCRAKIDEICGAPGSSSKTDGVRVTYIDYGHTDCVPLSEVVSLEGCSHSSLLTTPPLAQECRLALLKPAPDRNDGEKETLSHKAGWKMHDMAWEVPLIARVLAVERSADRFGGSSTDRRQAGAAGAASSNGSMPSVVSRALVALYHADDADGVSINERMVAAGLALVSARAHRLVRSRSNVQLPVAVDLLMDKVKDAQADAKRNHLNIFRYGDPDDSEDDTTRGYEQSERRGRQTGGNDDRRAAAGGRGGHASKKA